MKTPKELESNLDDFIINSDEVKEEVDQINASPDLMPLIANLLSKTVRHFYIMGYYDSKRDSNE